MKFEFRLKPMANVTPWRTETGRISLSWFGLTEGWFWIEVGDQELFRYSSAALNEWKSRFPDASPPLLPYEDYPVARYWEDLLEMLPSILDPLPTDLAARVNDAQAWSDRQQTAVALLEGDDVTTSDVYETALTWWRNRTWSAPHLAYPPHLWMWRAGDTIHLRWNNRDVRMDGISVWTADMGDHALSLSEFQAAVASFHRRFLAEMEQRVNQATTAWPRPDVEGDAATLRHEQAERIGWLEPAVSPWTVEVRRAFSWDEVRAAIARLDQRRAGRR